MTLDEFESAYNKGELDGEYYDWLYDRFPELGKHGLFNAFENGDYMESFMEYIGVE